MAEIIEQSKNGALKTQIMYKANLSFTQLSGYLRFLTRKNLLEKVESEGKESYKATQKGIDFLEKEQQIVDMLNEEGLFEESKGTSPKSAN